MDFSEIQEKLQMLKRRHNNQNQDSDCSTNLSKRFKFKSGFSDSDGISNTALEIKREIISSTESDTKDSPKKRKKKKQRPKNNDLPVKELSFGLEEFLISPTQFQFKETETEDGDLSFGNETDNCHKKKKKKKKFHTNDNSHIAGNSILNDSLHLKDDNVSDITIKDENTSLTESILSTHLDGVKTKRKKNKDKNWPSLNGESLEDYASTDYSVNNDSAVTLVSNPVKIKSKKSKTSLENTEIKTEEDTPNTHDTFSCSTPKRNKKEHKTNEDNQGEDSSAHPDKEDTQSPNNHSLKKHKKKIKNKDHDFLSNELVDSFGLSQLFKTPMLSQNSEKKSKKRKKNHENDSTTEDIRGHLSDFSTSDATSESQSPVKKSKKRKKNKDLEVSGTENLPEEMNDSSNNKKNPERDLTQSFNCSLNETTPKKKHKKTSKDILEISELKQKNEDPLMRLIGSLDTSDEDVSPQKKDKKYINGAAKTSELIQKKNDLEKTSSSQIVSEKKSNEIKKEDIIENHDLSTKLKRQKKKKKESPKHSYFSDDEETKKKGKEPKKKNETDVPKANKKIFKSVNKEQLKTENSLGYLRKSNNIRGIFSKYMSEQGCHFEEQSKSSLQQELEFAKIRCQLDDDNLRAMKDLLVTLPWSICELHSIETRVADRPSSAQKAQIKALKVEIKSGKFSPAEDKIIKKNWKFFCKLHNLPKDPTPFLSFTSPSGAIAIPIEERINFVRFLAHGLNNRLLCTVYSRFKRMCSQRLLVTGRYSPEEDQKIMEFIKSTTSEKPYSDLARLLNRERLSVEKRCIKLQNSIVTSVKRLTWNRREVQEFMKHLVDITKVGAVDELKDKKITKEQWTELSERLEIPVDRLRNGWTSTIYSKLFLSKSYNTHDVNKCLIKLLLDRGETSWASIDWTVITKEINKEYEGFTSIRLQRHLKYLIERYVPAELQRDLKDSLDYLKKDVIGSFKLRKHSFQKVEVVDLRPQSDGDETD